ncbi:hypothetical protein TNCV_4155461 [Trichonephila clavipes]|nr:hypothetical protein TNCV_4155461 [Trichonephila clavipes]
MTCQPRSDALITELPPRNFEPQSSDYTSDVTPISKLQHHTHVKFSLHQPLCTVGLVLGFEPATRQRRPRVRDHDPLTTATTSTRTTKVMTTYNIVINCKGRIREEHGFLTSPSAMVPH